MQERPVLTSAVHDPADPFHDPVHDPVHDAVRDEQVHLDQIYRRLDELRRLSQARLAGALQDRAGTAQAAGERDASAALHRRRLQTFDAVEADLCFGRLDRCDDLVLRIGRIGLFDDGDDHAPLLTDWRAPAARPFYTATAVSPEGIRRRRFIVTRRRRVTGVDDERLTDPDAAVGPDAAPGVANEGLVGEAALLAALSARRTGRMTDIVRTIQVEQDHVIRAPLDGVLVVQGGPGTGKTAVALHRAAYLLFTHRERLSRRGVLLVGPNRTFLRYVSHVLPSLAETGVLMRTPGELFPGVEAVADEPPAVAALKGRADMVDVVAAAVADRQALPAGALEVTVDGDPVRLERAEVAAIRDRARAAALPHNAARRVFARGLVFALARRLAERIGHDPFGHDPLGGDDAPGVDNVLGAEDVAELAELVRRERSVRLAVARLWPTLTPQRLLADLWASPDRLAAAAPHLSDAERALLHRPPGPAGPGGPAGLAGAGWAPSEVPLLDEAAELLGDDGSAARARAAERAAWLRELAYAEGVLEVARGSGSLDAEAGEGVLQATDVLGAEDLARRHAGDDDRTAAERAAADRTWTFGHVLVDEAQELTPMAWRLLMRRCPTRSFTVVGDLAQAGAGGLTTWEAAFAPHVGDRWRLAELTVGYRTPREVMDVATALLPRIAPGTVAPRAVRSTGHLPWARRVTAAGLAVALADAVRTELDRADGGTVGVVVPDVLLPELSAAVATTTAGPFRPGEPDLDERVVVVGVRQVKGLEFDTVLVVEPAGIVEQSPRGESDLYVALTRPTQRLGVLHLQDLPPELKPLLRSRDPV